MGNLGKHLSSGKSHRKPSDGGSYPLQCKVSMVRCLDVLWMVGIGLARLKKLSTCPNQPSRLHPNTACPISAPSLCTRKFSFAAGAGQDMPGTVGPLGYHAASCIADGAPFSVIGSYLNIFILLFLIWFLLLFMPLSFNLKGVLKPTWHNDTNNWYES
jgi:hypothetical protein